ncbi:hypothetical protein [Candidatus Uabimicrobium amorphum]|uniref:FHA domain-containing protein n=1 Tax=Uabimicrobium amorphum TaxID=2596890 RepID=A0A5S9IPT9_UABAM|nr:hypothetical protein [Candidatus Uabimicrobium amorphum]BBM85461.1 hypothetical protein UABAM_03828 [Candidatus Uabimicrobium amorphum]
MAAYLKEIKSDASGKSYSVCSDKNYFLIGRKKENDLVIGVSEVSRFNCFIAVHPQSKDLYLFSTSRNRNILYNANVCDFSSKESIVASSLDALLSMQTGVPVSEVPTKNEKGDQLIDAENMENLGFFRVGGFKKIRDILPVLDELQQVEYFEHCIKEGAVKLKSESFIGIRTSSIEIVYQLMIE